MISFLAAPQDFNLGPDAIICPGESIVLAAPVTPGNITWQDGSNASTFVANNEQVYWLQLSNNCGTETDSMTINLDDNIPILDIDSPIPWCNGDLVTLDATQVFDAIYLWDDGSSFPSLQVVTPGEYAVSVMTDCYTVDQEVMVVPGDCSNEIYVPSVFSPNEDGFNDVFTIFFGSDLDITGAQCSVYDRWGNMVFDTQTLPVAWDGRFRDSDMSPGVYAYVIIAEYMDRGRQRREVIRGDITLIR